MFTDATQVISCGWRLRIGFRYSHLHGPRPALGGAARYSGVLVVVEGEGNGCMGGRGVWQGRGKDKGSGMAERRSCQVNMM